MNWSLLNCFLSTKIPSYWYEYTEIRIWLNVPLKDMSMERVRVEEFGESKDADCGWVNLVFLYGFSLKILSRSSLHFVGIRVFIVGCMRNAKCQFSSNRAFWQLDLMIGPSREFESQANCLAKLEVLSWKFCPRSFVPSAPPTCFTRVPFWRLASRVPVTRSSRETSLNCTLLEISSHFLSHYPYIIPT